MSKKRKEEGYPAWLTNMQFKLYTNNEEPNMNEETQTMTEEEKEKTALLSAARSALIVKAAKTMKTFEGKRKYDELIHCLRIIRHCVDDLLTDMNVIITGADDPLDEEEVENLNAVLLSLLRNQEKKGHVKLPASLKAN